MKTGSKNNIAFTFASSEVNFVSQQFIKLIELLTGKIKLKKLYDQYLLENNPPEQFWNDAIKKLQLNLKTSFQDGSYIPKKGRLIIVANHAFGVADGLSFIFSYITIKYFLIYLKRFNFNLIIGYRLILGVIILSVVYL